MDLDRGRLDNHSSIYSNIDNTVKFLFLKTSVVKFEAWKWQMSTFQIGRDFHYRNVLLRFILYNNMCTIDVFFKVPNLSAWVWAISLWWLFLHAKLLYWSSLPPPPKPLFLSLTPFQLHSCTIKCYQETKISCSSNKPDVRTWYKG